MCAIAGLIDLMVNEDTKRNMLKTMYRRGPDQQGVFHNEQCCLLHSRLSIIDPEFGLQPMSVENNHTTYTIVYNGELYNSAEVKSELIKLGHSFQTRCDTEIVLHAYMQWRYDAPEHLNGIFSFAVWDSRDQSLFLCRDRIGVKPLFYALHNGGILFASEIKTILQYPTMQAVLDAEGAAQIVLLGPGRIPGKAVFQGIKELEPGYYGVYKNGKLSLKQYWCLRDGEHRDNFEETAEKVRFLVYDAIKRQMVSDVPIGTFLSGGLDSSIITAICAREMVGNGKTLDTFSVDYENNDRYFVPGKFQPSSDNDFIRLMNDRMQFNHHYTVLSPEDLMDALEPATMARDLPGMADVDFSLLAFCADIRKNVKVALSGECADEIFGGYPWYRDPEVLARQGFPWAQNTAYRQSFLHPCLRSRIKADEFVMDHYNATIEGADILPENDAQNRRIKQMVNLNFRWFMQTLLDRKDRMSMHNSLEVRVPFCDHRIAEYLYTVPWEFKEYANVEKGLLRYAMSDILPKEILWRKKSPYPKTYDPRYLQIVSERLKEILDDDSTPIRNIMDKNALEQLLNSEYSWPWYGQLMRLPQTIAYVLQVNYWLKEYKITLNF